MATVVDRRSDRHTDTARNDVRAVSWADVPSTGCNATSFAVVYHPCTHIPPSITHPTLVVQAGSAVAVLVQYSLRAGRHG